MPLVDTVQDKATNKNSHSGLQSGVLIDLILDSELSL